MANARQNINRIPMQVDDGIAVPAFVSKTNQQAKQLKHIDLRGEDVKKVNWTSLQRLDEMIGDLLSNDKEPSGVLVKYKFRTDIDGKKQKTRGKIKVGKTLFK